MDKKRLQKVLFVCIVLILVLAIFYSGLRILESTVFFDITDQLQTKSKILVRDGVKYYPRKDITVLMLMGINRSGKDISAYPNGSFDELIEFINKL